MFSGIELKRIDDRRWQDRLEGDLGQDEVCIERRRLWRGSLDNTVLARSWRTFVLIFTVRLVVARIVMAARGVASSGLTRCFARRIRECQHLTAAQWQPECDDCDDEDARQAAHR